jgi:hypothetical protein
LLASSNRLVERLVELQSFVQSLKIESPELFTKNPHMTLDAPEL